MTLVKDDILLNSGCLKLLNLIIPENCLLKPVRKQSVKDLEQNKFDKIDAVHTHLTNFSVTDPEVVE